ncbi:hypothetical protein PtrV1_13648 [Pyrenophora tritici-repentis]|uniref:Uncharacterized protein n=1 Tax=Pyrenophora tritici-repentis TaxID=45151 RepID=A0A5M9KMH7_9PLEO|nr:hypothetical protein PtrV1_13648 [Pyrenophora tritici-repentis]KAF7569692.1 hypothetical protein PtrM4_121070 [Pyrenophora tritici-repentis]KAI0606481.1 hypothetical protein TUN205_09282 [Pyrenophora tritici-repentis]
MRTTTAIFGGLIWLALASFSNADCHCCTFGGPDKAICNNNNDECWFGGPDKYGHGPAQGGHGFCFLGKMTCCNHPDYSHVSCYDGPCK